MTGHTRGDEGGSRRPRLADVAELAQVHPSIVSRVLNGDEALSVRSSTRQRVLDAAEELDYRPDHLGRGLRTRRTSAYGLVIPDFSNPVYAAVIEGAQAAAEESGAALVTSSFRVSRRAGTDYLALGLDRRVDGLLLAGSVYQDRVPANEAAARLPIPVIHVNRRPRRSRRFVVLDDEHAARLAVEHLVALGHERIGHISGPPDADTAQRRLRGFNQAMTEEIPHRRQAGSVVFADYTPTGGAQAMTELLELAAPPTAVVAANVLSALGALRMLNARGVQVPTEMSMIAIHDMELAEFSQPPLTTIRMPLSRMGRMALELLSSRSADEPIEEVVRSPMELVQRDSTAPPLVQ